MSEQFSTISQHDIITSSLSEHDKENILKNIENLANYLNQSNNESFKLIECKGDQLSFIMKFFNFYEFGLKISFQIPENFDLNNITIAVYPIKNDKISEEKLNKLRNYLVKSVSVASQMSDDRRYFLKSLFQICLNYIEQNFSRDKIYLSKISSQAKSLSTTSQKSEKSTITTLSEEFNEKKPSMKTAGDVKNRIIWDESINKDFITVGYIDRFVGLKECEFNMFDWGDIVLADLNALAIPEHRIKYYKYKNEIIWNKETRLDNVFGSAGSNMTITDVIEKFKNDKEQTEGSYKLVEDSEDEFEQKLGKNNINLNVQNRKSPNYFVSIPINDLEIKEKLFDLRCDLINSNENLEHFLLPDESYHLTLFTLRIENENELDTIKNLYDVMRTEEEFLKNLPINLHFEGLGEFYNKVLHIKCKSEEIIKLENLRNYIINKFKLVNINVEAGNCYPFVPHLTIFKITKSNTNSMRNSCSSNTQFKKLIQPSVSTLVSEHIFKKYSNLNFGKQNFKELNLCKMVNIYEKKNYPIESKFKFESD